MSNTREYYLDNLRTISIMSLFLFHACEIYYINEGFYIEGEEYLIPTLIYNFPSPWLMGLLFFIAGISTMYSLKRRNLKEYYIDRIKRILIPFLAGIAFWVPWGTYFVLKNHFDYQGTVREAYRFFFSNLSEGLYGYDGGFTPSHLWFLIYLFIITIICFPLIRMKLKNPQKLQLRFGTKWLMVITAIMYIVAYGTSDESIGKFIIFFSLGIILYDNDSFYDYLERNWKALMIAAVISDCLAAYILVLNKYIEVWTWQYAFMRGIWACACSVSVFACMAFGKVKLNRNTNVMRYFAKRSFAIYYIHMIILIVIGYYVLEYIPIHYGFQILIIMILAEIVTLILTEMFRRIPMVGNKFGFK